METPLSPESKVGATIAQQVAALTPAAPAPRDEAGRFTKPEARPVQDLRPKYDHPVLEEQEIHKKLVDIVSKDGTSDQWMQDAPSTPAPEEAPATKPDEAPPETPAEEPAPATEGVEIDYEAPIFETTVKTEGGQDETLKLSLKDLQSGYMRQADYQRKTQEVAKQREQVQTQVQQEAANVQQAYEQQLNVLRASIVQMAAPELQNVDWTKLAADDPAEFVRLSAKANQLKQSVAQIDGQLQQRQWMAEEQQKTAVAKAVQESIETLQRDIPGWNNELYASVIKGGEEFGFSREELTNVYDARVIKVLHDAAKYRQLQQAKPEIAKKVVTVPKVMKPGTQSNANPQAAAAGKAASRLNETGRWQDAAALLLTRGIK